VNPLALTRVEGIAKTVAVVDKDAVSEELGLSGD
jgi:hypothetical protein